MLWTVKIQGCVVSCFLCLKKQPPKLSWNISEVFTDTFITHEKFSYYKSLCLKALLLSLSASKQTLQKTLCTLTVEVSSSNG